MKRICVTGAGGFIGHHLTKRLKAEGFWVRGVDVKLPEYEPSAADEFVLLDLRNAERPFDLVGDGVDEMYHLACDMGGIGHTLPHSFEQRLNNSRIDQNVIQIAEITGVEKIFFASSACVYNDALQGDLGALALKEEDAYPAHPDLSYGWVKLQAEMLLEDLRLNSDMEVRIARFHNCYGELGVWRGNKEKAPAALCRKIATAKLRGEESISVWGDGLQKRSFMYIDDCIEGIRRLMDSEHHEPLNLGRDEQISIDELALLIMDCADYYVRIEHDLTKPQGVRSRNSNNTKLQQVLGWSPQISLADGLAETYQWIEQEVKTYLETKEQF